MHSVALGVFFLTLTQTHLSSLTTCLSNALLSSLVPTALNSVRVNLINMIRDFSLTTKLPLKLKTVRYFTCSPTMASFFILRIKNMKKKKNCIYCVVGNITTIHITFMRFLYLSYTDCYQGCFSPGVYRRTSKITR